MFKRKKKKEEPEKVFDYKEWEKEFGFLNLILERKKAITKNFLIKTFADQLQGNNSFVTDEDIKPLIEKTINEVVSIISKNYKDFLIEKYFGTLENFVAFIAEDVFVDLTVESVNANSKKIAREMNKNRIKSISNMNLKKEKKNS